MASDLGGAPPRKPGAVSRDEKQRLFSATTRNNRPEHSGETPIVDHHVRGHNCGGKFPPSIRTVLATAAEKGWTVRQLDVCSSALYSDVEEKVWVNMAPGVEIQNEDTGAPLVIKMFKLEFWPEQEPQELAWNH